MTKASAKVRVLIVEDSAVAATLLEHVLNADPHLTVVGIASSGEQALTLLPKLRPDVVLMDVRLPGIDGVETTRRIMRIQPTPIVVTSAALNDFSVTISMDALRAGALSVIEKPLAVGRPEYAKLAKRLCTQIKIMSQVHVIRQRHQPLAMPARPALPVTGALAASRSDGSRGQELSAATDGYRILGLVASTGGPNALARILGVLPGDFPLPVVLVQHIGAEFAEGFAAWLDTQTALSVALATHGERLKPGRVHVAPGYRHLKLKGPLLMLDDGPLVSGQRPSGTVLFQSMADDFGPQAIGALLTGMGDDGAQGLLAMRVRGAYTIAESEATAVVYGMPAVAARLGAARIQLPLDAIGACILNAIKAQRDA